MTPLDPILRMVLGSATMAVEIAVLLLLLESLRAGRDDEWDEEALMDFILGCSDGGGGGASMSSFVFFRVDLTISSWTMTRKLVRCLWDRSHPPPSQTMLDFFLLEDGCCDDCFLPLRPVLSSASVWGRCRQKVPNQHPVWWWCKKQTKNE